MNLFDQYKDPELCKKVLEKINSEIEAPFRFMEVCGTHTVSIFQSGIRSLLPDSIEHLSGPGCPVCVTHDREVATFLDIALDQKAILTTFGDLMRVPGPGGQTLKTAQADGARIEIVYSPFDSLAIAEANPDSQVVFIGVGFETTAPGVAATIKTAKAKNLKNFSVLSFHKLVPPALKVLLDDPATKIDTFLLPGHVSTIIGRKAYDFLDTQYKIPAVVAGFEPLDILEALLVVIRLINKGERRVVNAYPRGVSEDGNPRAVETMLEVFEPGDALWRGIGTIPASGLKFRKEFSAFDALQRFSMAMPEVREIPGCRCGDVLKGSIPPNKCPLFGKVCTPAKPVGPCMVSTEGSCAAYFKYQV